MALESVHIHHRIGLVARISTNRLDHKDDVLLYNKRKQSKNQSKDRQLSEKVMIDTCSMISCLLCRKKAREYKQETNFYLVIILSKTNSNKYQQARLFELRNT